MVRSSLNEQRARDWLAADSRLLEHEVELIKQAADERRMTDECLAVATRTLTKEVDSLDSQLRDVSYQQVTTPIFI